MTGLVQARPTSEAQAQDLSDAQVFAEEHPDDVGYPWIDPASGRLELSAASALGIDLLDHQRSAFATATRIREVKFSFGKLEAIKHEVTTLHAEGVPDADLIYQTAPDHESNRTVITVSEPSEQLFKVLADRYGTEALAVRIDPRGRGTTPASRLSDYSPYWGGARILAPAGYCTDSFAWSVNTYGDSMLTAAHCAPLGGTVSIDQQMGAVTANSGEN